MNRRKGVTLTEVLVTMFVMAIGLLALLALFPLAALNMAQAIQDDRVALCAANAEAIANMYWDFRPCNDAAPTASVPNYHTGRLFLGGPQVGGGTPQLLTVPGRDEDVPSWPVFVDPIGANASGQWKNWVGGVVNGVRRIDTPWIYANSSPLWGQTGASLFFPTPASAASSAVPNKFYIYQTHVLQDDLIYDKTSGMPFGAGTALKVQRENRYSWSYMFRRPRVACTGVVDMQIIVYAGHGIYATGGDNAEVQAPTAQGVAGTNAVTITLPSGVVLRKGTWVLDVSNEPPNSPGYQKFGPVHAHFYRVQNVILSGPSSRTLELQTNLLGNVSKLVILGDVVEVFDKGSGWQMPHLRNDT